MLGVLRMLGMLGCWGVPDVGVPSAALKVSAPSGREPSLPASAASVAWGPLHPQWAPQAARRSAGEERRSCRSWLRLRLRLQCRLPASGGLLRSSACLGRRCVDTTRGRRPGSGRGRRRGVRRRRDRPVVRPVDGRRGDDDLFGRRCAGTRSGPDRGAVHGARVEEQGHRSRAEEQRNHRRRHSPSDYPDCEPLPAFVGRHRPLLPFPWTGLPRP